LTSSVQKLVVLALFVKNDNADENVGAGPDSDTLN